MLWSPPARRRPELWAPTPATAPPRAPGHSGGAAVAVDGPAGDREVAGSAHARTRQDPAHRGPGRDADGRRFRKFARVARLRIECADEFKAGHGREWPEVVKHMQTCNISQYSVIHDPATHLVFASFKYTGYDFAGDMERFGEHDRVVEWRNLTEKWLEPVDGSAGVEAGKVPGLGGVWSPVDEVIYKP
ncbi:hypothetical protein TD95_003189 [Thielaviopsis punctulata]|uniref:DUF718 domain-containing protein n=1 Tax=Thielaviopsis punctulata TaxID=72032 RepID=A0A0F4ZE83_9PEZI|nr:hypothetical protein TD95_003189 [Thielaviopsis punctulata]